MKQRTAAFLRWSHPRARARRDRPRGAGVGRRDRGGGRDARGAAAAGGRALPEEERTKLDGLIATGHVAEAGRLLLRGAEAEAEATCPLCMELFGGADEFVACPRCGVRFHGHCLSQHLTGGGACPNCRFALHVVAPRPPSPRSRRGVDLAVAGGGDANAPSAAPSARAERRARAAAAPLAARAAHKVFKRTFGRGARRRRRTRPTTTTTTTARTTTTTTGPAATAPPRRIVSDPRLRRAAPRRGCRRCARARVRVSEDIDALDRERVALGAVGGAPRAARAQPPPPPPRRSLLERARSASCRRRRPELRTSDDAAEPPPPPPALASARSEGSNRALEDARARLGPLDLERAERYCDIVVGYREELARLRAAAAASSSADDDDAEGAEVSDALALLRAARGRRAAALDAARVTLGAARAALRAAVAAGDADSAGRLLRDAPLRSPARGAPTPRARSPSRSVAAVTRDAALAVVRAIDAGEGRALVETELEDGGEEVVKDAAGASGVIDAARAAHGDLLARQPRGSGPRYDGTRRRRWDTLVIRLGARARRDLCCAACGAFLPGAPSDDAPALGRGGMAASRVAAIGAAEEDAFAPCLRCGGALDARCLAATLGAGAACARCGEPWFVPAPMRLDRGDDDCGHDAPQLELGGGADADEPDVPPPLTDDERAFLERTANARAGQSASQSIGAALGGRELKACPMCGAGPLLNEHCSDLAAHNGQCPRCRERPHGRNPAAMLASAAAKGAKSRGGVRSTLPRCARCKVPVMYNGCMACGHSFANTGWGALPRWTPPPDVSAADEARGGAARARRGARARARAARAARAARGPPRVGRARGGAPRRGRAARARAARARVARRARRRRAARRARRARARARARGLRARAADRGAEGAELIVGVADSVPRLAARAAEGDGACGAALVALVDSGQVERVGACARAAPALRALALKCARPRARFDASATAANDARLARALERLGFEGDAAARAIAVVGCGNAEAAVAQATFAESSDGPFAAAAARALRVLASRGSKTRSTRKPALGAAKRLSTRPSPRRPRLRASPRASRLARPSCYTRRSTTRECARRKLRATRRSARNSTKRSARTTMERYQDSSRSPRVKASAARPSCAVAPGPTTSRALPRRKRRSDRCLGTTTATARSKALAITRGGSTMPSRPRPRRVLTTATSRRRAQSAMRWLHASVGSSSSRPRQMSFNAVEWRRAVSRVAPLSVCARLTTRCPRTAMAEAERAKRTMMTSPAHARRCSRRPPHSSTCKLGSRRSWPRSRHRSTLLERRSMRLGRS